MNQQRAALAAIAVVVPLAMVATLYTGATPQEAGSAGNMTRVVTSFYPLYDFASHVAGDRAEVSSLVPPGIEPHDWEPTLGDVNRARSADMLVINGAGFESWADGIGAKRIVNTSEGIELAGVDPHIWLDPVLAKEQVESIRAALALVDPENAGHYNENAAAYAAELDSLDSFIRAELATCEKSDFIAFHDAFSRFAERYGLDQHAIHDISPEGEVLPQRLQHVIELAGELGINVIYSEDMVDGRLAEVIADEIPGGKVLILSPIEGVDKEELAAGAGYIEKMKENVASLKEGLQCA
ncbi:MAG: metal ABC transporter solute-binding protein, Zn/Mn family [Nitrososphaera sp.]|uniref:metal ABC transporter solute-binding protein, Zn/Mn family n=1 Tax=Nitrososphaera sp. TaxID=1971748 RepID=UPI003D6E3237